MRRIWWRADRNDIFVGAVLAFLSRTVPVGRATGQSAHELKPHHEGPTGEMQDIP
jgi:hypothetical protein